MWLDQVAEESPGPAARYAARETVELAFVVALQQLSPRQAAALLLCDLLGFTVTEVAAMLDTTATSVKGLLQRARAALASAPGRPRRRPGALVESRVLARRFAEAFTADDIDGVVALLTDDAWLAMPPAPHEYVGAAAIASFLRASSAWRPSRHPRLVPVAANGQPAFACYVPDADGSAASF